VLVGHGVSSVCVGDVWSLARAVGLQWSPESVRLAVRLAVRAASQSAPEAVSRLAGSSAVIVDVARLEGGQHADTWRVDTDNPVLSVVVRQFRGLRA